VEVAGKQVVGGLGLPSMSLSSNVLSCTAMQHVYLLAGQPIPCCGVCVQQLV
jgi:hypothetical protein